MSDSTNVVPDLDFSDALQEAIVDRIKSHPWFATTGKPGDLMVLSEDDGDLINKITVSLTKLGMAIIVEAPEFSTQNANTALYFDDVTIEISIIENGIVNRGSKGFNKKVGRVAMEVLALCWNWTPPGLGACLYPAEKSLTKDRSMKEVNRLVRLRTSIALEPEIS